MRKSFVMGTLLMFVVIALSLILLQAGSVSSALGSGNDWIIEGDCVYWNNTKGDVRVCPHTLQGSGWAYFNVTSYLPASFNLDFAFGITENIVPSKPQIWANISHPVLVSNCTVSEVSIVNNGTPGTENRTTCNPYYAQNFYPDWQSVGGFSTAQYGGKMWYARSATLDSGETKSGRVWLDVKPMSGKSKYSVLIKKVSDTFAQAEANGNYVLLDPWVDSPPTVFNETFDNGAFINNTWGNLNVSRGWLVLNMTGYNATIFTRNTTDDGAAATCRNSSQDGGSIGSKTNYACSNLFDGVLSGADPIHVWSANGFNEPEWIVKDFSKAQWLYNVSFYNSVTATTWGISNSSFQCSDTAVTLGTISTIPGGSDSAANWGYATFNNTIVGTPPANQVTIVGQIRCRSLRFSLLNMFVPNHAIWLEEIEGNTATFNTSGQKMSILLNDTVTVQEVNLTCINTSGDSNEVGFNVTVMDKNYANEQTVTCGVAENGTGFRNDITDIVGLIYRVNASSSSSGLTPEIDYLTFRMKVTAPAVAVLPIVNVSILNRTSSNASVILASEHVWSNANYSHASNLPEENSTFKWLTNNTDSAGVRTAELVPMIYKGAVGYWHLDSVNGSNVTIDSTGYGNHGTLFGFNQSNATTAGIINNGFRFDGGQDRVIVQDINFNWSASNFTAVLWANMLSPAGAVGGLVSNRDGSGPWWTLGWYEYDIRGEIQLEIGNGSTQTYLRSGIYPANKGWQHYALTKSGLTWTLYYNGVLNKTITTAATFTNIGAQIADFAIGRWSGDTQVWNGSMDEVAVYNRSLSASEVKQLYLRTWYDVSPEVLLAHMDNASNNLVNATLMGSHQPAATLAGGVNCTAEVAGIYGQACKFDGVNDYINVSRNPILNFGKGDYSVEFWLNWTGSSSSNAIMGKRIQEGGGNWWRAYISDTGILTIEQENNNADLEMTPQVNKWYYVAVVRNVAAGTSYLYINGVQNDTAAATGLDVSNTDDFLIGKFTTTFFNGTIDEVRLSRKALTAQEINESFSKGRSFFQNEYLLNSSNYAAGDMLKLEYVPRDSAGAVGAVQNSSSLNVHAPKIADESEGDIAIEAGINSSIPSATKYNEQQVYVRNISNNQALGRFDWVAGFGSQRWLINYVTAGESYVTAPNLTTAVYVLEIADKTSVQIIDEVSKLINATKS